ncbi:MAG: hypothetical protein ACRCX5_11955 [Bacteroidales bacterium]
MNYLAKTLSGSIRFRRWSRKRYAAFCSLGKIISIGHLRCGIAEQSLIKQCQFDLVRNTCLNSETDTTDKESDLSAELSTPPLWLELIYSKAIGNEQIFQSSPDMSCLYISFYSYTKSEYNSI